MLEGIRYWLTPPVIVHLLFRERIEICSQHNDLERS